MSVLAPAAYAAAGPSGVSSKPPRPRTAHHRAGHDRRPARHPRRGTGEAAATPLASRRSAKAAPKRQARARAYLAGDRRTASRTATRHAIGGGGASAGKYQFSYAHLGRSGRHRRSRRGAGGGAGHARGDALRPQRRTGQWPVCGSGTSTVAPARDAVLAGAATTTERGCAPVTVGPRRLGRAYDHGPVGNAPDQAASGLARP